MVDETAKLSYHRNQKGNFGKTINMFIKILIIYIYNMSKLD